NHIIAIQKVNNDKEAIPRHLLDSIVDKKAEDYAMDSERMRQRKEHLISLFTSATKQLVMSLLFDEEGLSKSEFKQWIKNDKESLAKFDESFDKLTKLQMIEQHEKVVLNKSFRRSFQDCLTGSFGVPLEKHKSKPLDVSLLDQHAIEKWESILHFMV
ncbi:15298_t:CDS:2, partial [Acaulospora colombiana]